MKFNKNKFLTTVSAIALVLAVGACSSSGDDEMMTNGAATNGGDAATNGDGDATNGDGDATNGDGDAKTPAQALAAVEKTLMDASTDEDRAAAMTAYVAALMLEGNEAAYVAYLEKKVDDQAQTVADAAAKKVSDMAKEVLAAIGDNTGPVGSPFPQPAAPAVKLAASSAGELTATLEGYTMSAAPEEIAGWRGRTLTKDGDTTVIYTNIMDEVPTALGGRGGLYTKASAGPNAPENYTVNVLGGTDALPTIKWSDVKRADDSQTETGAGDDLVTTFAGSVRGVDGMFSCKTSPCMAPTENDMGELTGFEDADTGEWVFAPTDPNAKINVKDEAYVSFGWWLNAMGTAGAYEFDAFASVEGMGEDDLNAGMGRDLEGSATYKGGAAGKWAMQSTTDDSASGGHFTANATLTANFDANTAVGDLPANEDGVSIGGKIDGFMTGDVSRPNWKVTLSYDATLDEAENAATLGVQFLEAVAPITGAGATTKWATGGAVDGVGTWSANFYGSEKDTDHPTDVTGEFNAAIGGGDIGRISGAFGATK